MSRALSCPKCGATHALVNPGIAMLVCDHCNAVLYLEGAQIKVGRESILPPSDARLFMHASGTLFGKEYQVVGHLRYEYGRGGWDEWYLQLQDGSVAWLSEDERELRFQQPADPTGLPGYDQLQVGGNLLLGNANYSVRELGTATCIGGEGQLPFSVDIGEQYPYADIASYDGQQYGTVEWDSQHPKIFLGFSLTHEQLTIQGSRPDYMASVEQGRGITCTNCGGSLEVPGGRKVETLVCEYCGAQIDTTSDELAILGINPEDFAHQFLFDVGQPAEFRGAHYEVCGRMMYVENAFYVTREYLLFNPERGYLWLSQYNNHFVLSESTDRAPVSDPFLASVKSTVSVAGESFRKYESGVVSLEYVDGALPWKARVGDQFYYAELIAPPRVFGADRDGDEIEFFDGQYIPQQEVWDAFKFPSAPPVGKGVHAAQPYNRSKVARWLMLVGGVLAALNLVLFLWSLGKTGDQIFTARLTAQDYTKGYDGEPFQLPDTAIVTLKVAAPVSNSWISLNLALVDEADNVVAEMTGDVSYYSGYEGGEHWSEGSTKVTKYFRAPKAGTYRLIVQGAGGSGNYSNGPPRGETLMVSLGTGAVMSRYFLIAFIITLLFPLIGLIHRWVFEWQRWSPVTGDSDDDDSDWDWD